MILWRNIENYPFFIILISTPDFPHFYYMLGGNVGSLLYGNVSVMIFKNMVDWWMDKKKVFQCTPKHYNNTPMQYTAIFHRCKNYNFQMKNCYIFLIFAQKVDCGYMLKLLQQGGSNKCP